MSLTNPPIKPDAPQKRSVSFYSQGKGRHVVITGVALFALTMLAIGTMTIPTINHSLPPFFQFLIKIPLVGSGILIGSGGLFFSAALLIELYWMIGLQKNLPPEPNIISPVPDPIPQPTPKKRETLLYAMCIFKNFNHELARKCKHEESLSSFLIKIAEAYPKNSLARERLERLIAIQTAYDANELDKVISLYEDWKLEKGIDPFCFFIPFQEQNFKHYALVSIKKDQAPEKFTEYLENVQKNPKVLNNNLIGKIFHEFLGSFESDDSFKICKEIYKINLLKQILEDYPEWTEDPDFRVWVATALVHLNKVRPDLQTKNSSLETEWHIAHLTLKEIRRRYEELLPPPPQVPGYLSPFPQLEVNAISRIELLPYPGEDATYPEHAAVSPNGATASPPIRLPKYDDPKDMELLQEWHSYLLKAYRDGVSTTLLEGKAIQLLRHLPTPSNLRSFLDKLSQEERELFSLQIYEISNLALCLQILAQNLGIHPYKFLGILKGIAALLTACQSISTTCLEGFTIPCRMYLHNFLCDPFYDLGPDQAMFSQMFDEMDQSGNNTVALSDLTCQSEWFDLYNFEDIDKESPDIKEKIEDDYEGNFIPRPLARLRSLVLLTESFGAPATCLSANVMVFSKTTSKYKKNLVKLQKSFSVLAETLSKNRELLSVQREIDNTLDPPRGRKFTKIKPFSNLKFGRYGTHEPKMMGFPTSIYYYSLGYCIANSAILTRLVEGMLSEATTPDFIRADGACRFYDDDIRLILPGLKQSQHKVLQDQFAFSDASIEVSHDLQLMVSGRHNRASNALYIFKKHPHLFSQAIAGESYRSVFRLCLFRQNLLMHELELNPHTAQETLANFDKMLAQYEKTKDLKTWSFLYKVHVDVLANLRDASSINQKIKNERQSQHLKHSNTLSKLMSTANDPDQLNDLHLAYLYENSVLGFQNAELINVARKFFAVKSLINQMCIKPTLEGPRFFHLSCRLSEELIRAIEADKNVLNELMPPRPGNDAVWNEINRGVYKRGNLQIDFNVMDVIREGKKEGCLPLEIRQNLHFKALFDDDVLTASYHFTCVKTPYGNAWRTIISQNKTIYALYFASNNPKLPLLYRQNSEGEWEQWIRLNNTATNLPLDFQQGFLWTTKKGEVLEDSKGKHLYTPHFEGERLTLLERHTNNHKEIVLDPKSAPFFSLIGAQNGYVATKNDKNTPIVVYCNSNYGYIWNNSESKWESSLYKGYFLIQKPIETWNAPATQLSTGMRPSFFSSTFKNYHLLENHDGKAKLIIPCCRYQRLSADAKISEKEMKYSRDLVPVFDDALQNDNGMYAVFNIENNIHLTSKRPQDFLFLSYLFFIQGKYGDALLYLERSRAIWTASDANLCQLRRQVKEWVLQWNDPSPNAAAFRTKLFLTEHQVREASFPQESDILSIDRELLPNLIKEAERYAKHTNEVDPLLRLSQQDIEDIESLALRAHVVYLSQQDNKDKSNFERNPFLSKEAFQYLITRDPTPQEALKWSLDKAIEKIEAKTPKQPQQPSSVQPTEYRPIPLVDVTPYLVPLSQSEAYLKAKEKADNFSSQLKEVFSGNTLADSIGQELANDIEKYASKREEELTLAENVNLTRLVETVLLPEETHLQKEELQYKQAIISQLIPPTLSPNQVTERRLKEEEAIYDAAFEEARFCFGTGDFSSLIEKKIIAKRQIPSLKEALLNYEITRTDRKLMTRKREAIQKLAQNQNSFIFREECANLLQQWRQYDPRNDAHANILLLFEDECNLTARSSQILHIVKLVTHPDSYIHEAMAGGKTTLLRNVFSAIEAKNQRLAGVVTYAPLMAMHHKEYAHVNQMALGSTAYPFYYHRNAPHDAAALKLMILYHLKALTRGGRIDQTPQAIISLSHTLTELITALEVSDPKMRAEFEEEIHALQKLLKLRKDHLSLYSDELDRLFDPMKDNNYSVKGTTILEDIYYKPALELFRMIFDPKSRTDFPKHPCWSDQDDMAYQSHLRALSEDMDEFLHAIQNRRLKQMDDDRFEKVLASLAELAFYHYKLPFDKEQTILYLTEAHQKDPIKQAEIIQFYEKEILAHKDPSARKNAQILHAYIGILMRGIKNKMVGTDFGRSEDGISTKPFRFSAVCQETSQRSFVLSTILETCMDYFVSGIGIEAARAYFEKIREKINNEARIYNVAADNTPEAQTFRTRFDMNFSEVKEKDYATIAKKLDNSFELICECLTEVRFKNFTFYQHKIEGNAHHIPHVIGHFSGSSGSPERVLTLPPSIHKHDKLKRQEGAIGSVFYSLLKNFDIENDMIELEPNQPLESQLAALLQPGDTLVDNAPLFSGKKGIEIVHSLASATKNVSEYRFLNESDDICIWKDNEVHQGEEGIDLNNTVSVIDHKGRQGTNWTFAKGTKGIVEMGVDTELTSFYQSLMRLRLLGKGQTAKVVYDPSLKQQWDKCEALKGKPAFVKMVWSLAHNEANLLKHLHNEANRKQIKAIRKKAVDRMLMEVSDVEALHAIKSTPAIKLTTVSKLTPTQCGQPLMMAPALESLQNLIENEETHLKTLYKEIYDLSSISDVVKSQCLDILKEALNNYKDKELLMTPDNLPELAVKNLNYFSIDGMEEIEVEAHNQQEVAEETQEEISFEVENSMEIEANNQLEKEFFEDQQHPAATREGREWEERNALHYRQWFPHFIKELDWNEDGNGYIDPKLFPGISASGYAFGMSLDQIVEPTTWLQWKKDRLWYIGNPQQRNRISAKVLMAVSANKNVICQLASVNETDRYFYGPLKEQKKIEQLDSPDTYQHVYKIDLNQTQIPDSLPNEYHQKWIRQMALVKFIYVDAPFSQEEEASLLDWLDSSPFQLDVLEKKLTAYLSHCFPNNKERNQLLSILQKKMGKK